jgi:hypothetical protein
MAHDTRTLPDQLPTEVEAMLAAMAGLSTASLWEIVQQPAPPADAAQLADLNDRRQREGLDAADERRAHELAERLGLAMLRRAQAVALLHARGEDVGELVRRA